MRSTGSGPLGALLVLAPLIAVPILAVVGIPQFAPGNLTDFSGVSPTQNRAGRSSETRLGVDSQHDVDLFAPLEESSSELGEFEDPLDSEGSSRSRRDSQESFDQGERTFSGRGRSNSGDRSGQRKRSFGDSETDAAEFQPDSTDGEMGEESSSIDSESFEKGANSSGGRGRGRDIAEEEFEEGPDNRQKVAPRNRKRGGSIGNPFSEPEGGDALEFEENDSERSASSSQRERSERSNPDFREFEDESVGRNPPRTSSAKSRTQPKAPKKGPARDTLDAPAFLPEGAEQTAALDEFFDQPRSSGAGNPSAKPTQKQTKPGGDRSSPETSSGGNSEREELEGAEPSLEVITWRSATQRLRSLGVASGKQYFTYLEDVNRFQFTCSATHKKNPSQMQRFKAEADDPLLAVRMVLEQVTAWQATPVKRNSSVTTREQFQ